MKVCRQLSSPVRTLMVVLCSAVCIQGAAATDPFLTLSQPEVTNGQVQFTLTGESHVDYVIEGSGHTQLWSPLVTNSALGITRTISLTAPATNTFYRASRVKLPVFAAGIATKSWADIKGNTLRVDSFDSADPLHDDPLDPLEVKDHGDVATATGLTNVQNVEIKGKLKTVPSWPIFIGPNGSVGGLAWAGPGIQPGWYEDDFRFVFRDVEPPYTSGVPPIEISKAVSTNRWVLGGDYYYPGNVSFHTGENILVTNHTRLFVLGEFVMSGTSEIKIIPGATLELYLAGPRAVFTRVSTAGDALSFSYFGLPTNTSINWSGNAEYKGSVYAPQATFTCGGGGLNVNDFQGACVAKSVILNGHFLFHFDENLMRVGPMR